MEEKSTYEAKSEFLAKAEEAFAELNALRTDNNAIILIAFENKGDGRWSSSINLSGSFANLAMAVSTTILKEEDFRSVHDAALESVIKYASSRNDAQD